MDGLEKLDGFRLLNSEIGNDQEYVEMLKRESKECFRLLNSEIGNDQVLFVKLSLKKSSFRLLNSEIGNDQSFENTEVLIDVKFSSP